MPEACVAAPASSRELQTASGSPSRGRLFRQRLRRLPGEQLNGIAVAVLESKRSTVSVGEGIRQDIDNQKPQFIQSSLPRSSCCRRKRGPGLALRRDRNPARNWLRWKETEAHPQAGDNPLFRELGRLCAEDRLLELIHDFTAFDGYIRKKKPLSCLDYILVHEMVHLLERHHNDRFRTHLARVRPTRRLHRDELDQTPPAHDDRGYGVLASSRYFTRRTAPSWSGSPRWPGSSRR